jgi:hypothetical protein
MDCKSVEGLANDDGVSNDAMDDGNADKGMEIGTIGGSLGRSLDGGNGALGAVSTVSGAPRGCVDVPATVSTIFGGMGDDELRASWEKESVMDTDKLVTRMSYTSSPAANNNKASMRKNDGVFTAHV